MSYAVSESTVPENEASGVFEASIIIQISSSELVLVIS